MPYKDKNDPRNIAYKKAYYERTKVGRYQRVKHNIYKWREQHPDKYDALKKEYYADNRKSILEKQKTPERKLKASIKEKKDVAELSDRYMKKHLLKLGYTRKDIRKYPDLIETHKLIIKTKRLCKTSNN